MNLIKSMIFLLIVFVAVLVDISTASVYYNENFSSGSSFSNKWDCDVRMGREGYILDNVHTSKRTVLPASNRLSIIDRPLSNTSPPGGGFHQVFVGRAVKLTNLNSLKTFSADEYNPFGVELVRRMGYVWWGNDNGWQECVADNNLWLIEENYAAKTNFSKINNYVFMYEMSRYNYTPNSRWGYYKGAENTFSLANAKRPNGITYDLSSYLQYNYSGGQNNNRVGLKMTFDGSKVQFFVNPDAAAINVHPSEYILLGESLFGVRSNLRIMIGHENNFTYPVTRLVMPSIRIF